MTSFLSNLTEGHESLCYGGAPSSSRQLFPVTDFLSRTIRIRPILTTLGRRHAWGLGIHICSNKKASHFWDSIRSKRRTILLNVQKYSSHKHTGRNVLIIWHGSSLGTGD